MKIQFIKIWERQCIKSDASEIDWCTYLAPIMASSVPGFTMPWTVREKYIIIQIIYSESSSSKQSFLHLRLLLLTYQGI